MRRMNFAQIKSKEEPEEKKKFKVMCYQFRITANLAENFIGVILLKRSFFIIILISFLNGLKEESRKVEE